MECTWAIRYYNKVEAQSSEGGKGHNVPYNTDFFLIFIDVMLHCKCERAAPAL